MRTGQDLLTLEEYAALVEPDDEHVSELVRGAVVREPRPGKAHGFVQASVAAHLHTWARGTPARVSVESGYILSDEPATLRGPDVGLVLEPRSSEAEPGGWIRGSPDVAVEVLSPSDTSMAILQKTREYFGAGARQVWVVDPAGRTVTVHRADGSARVLGGDDTLDGEDVLPGFAVGVSELFEEED